jgi:hypothetical protein
MGLEMLVPLSAVGPSRMASRPAFSEGARIVMLFDRSRIPAVILVVEDEMMLRMRAADMVEDAGYAPR